MLSDGRGDGPRRKRVFRAFARSVRGTGVLVLGLTCTGASLPEGFPEDLVPENSQVLTSITNTESDGTTQLAVSFAVEDGGEDLFSYYVDTLEDAGYTIGTRTKMQDSGGGTEFVEASNEEEQSVEVMVMNAEEGGSEAGTTVQVWVVRQERAPGVWRRGGVALGWTEPATGGMVHKHRRI